jgi:hypothetical protein
MRTPATLFLSTSTRAAEAKVEAAEEAVAYVSEAEDLVADISLIVVFLKLNKNAFFLFECLFSFFFLRFLFFACEKYSNPVALA